MEMAGEKIKFMQNIKEKKIQYISQSIRTDDRQRQLLEGKIIGKGRRRRKRRKWMTDITDWMQLTYVECVRASQDRQR